MEKPNRPRILSWPYEGRIATGIVSDEWVIAAINYRHGSELTPGIWWHDPLYTDWDTKVDWRKVRPATTAEESAFLESFLEAQNLY